MHCAYTAHVHYILYNKSYLFFYPFSFHCEYSLLLLTWHISAQTLSRNLYHLSQMGVTNWVEHPLSIWDQSMAESNQVLTYNNKIFVATSTLLAAHRITNINAKSWRAQYWNNMAEWAIMPRCRQHSAASYLGSTIKTRNEHTPSQVCTRPGMTLSCCQDISKSEQTKKASSLYHSAMSQNPRREKHQESG